MSTIQLIKSDYSKYKKYGGNFFSIVFLTQGFWAIFQYRIANYFFRNLKLVGVRQLILFILLLWKKGIEICAGISIPCSVEIGHSFYVGHFGGIIINTNSKIGNNCNFSQGVTIGVSGIGENRGVPTIGDNVYIGANAVVSGKIYIEDNVLIGACSLVNSNAEANAIYLGVPAIKISNRGSKEYI